MSDDPSGPVHHLGPCGKSCKDTAPKKADDRQDRADPALVQLAQRDGARELEHQTTLAAPRAFTAAIRCHEMISRPSLQ